MNREKIEKLDERVTENSVDIEILQGRMKKQDSINESVEEAFSLLPSYVDVLTGEISFLKKLAGVFAFTAGGLFVLVLKTKADIREIRKAMNEG